MPGAAELWVTTAAGPYPAATHAGHRTATPVVSAAGEAAIVLQLMPDTCGCQTAVVILTLAKNSRGAGERPEGRPGRPARGFLLLAAARGSVGARRDGVRLFPARGGVRLTRSCPPRRKQSGRAEDSSPAGSRVTLFV